MTNYPRGHHGFGIVQLLVYTGVVAIIALALTQINKHQLFSSKFNKAVSVRNDLLKRLSSVTSDPYALKHTSSAPSNNLTNINACATTGCNVDSTTTWTEVDVYDGTGGWTGTGARVAGKSSSPVYYDLSGAQCTTPSASCVLQAVGYFIPNCGTSAPPCIASNVYTSIWVTAIPTLSSIGVNFYMKGDSTLFNQGVPVTPSSPGAGVTGYIPVWNDLHRFTNSSILEDLTSGPTFGNITIGPGAPANLSITGNLNVQPDAASVNAFSLHAPSVVFNGTGNEFPNLMYAVGNITLTDASSSLITHDLAVMNYRNPPPHIPVDPSDPLYGNTPNANGIYDGTLWAANLTTYAYLYTYGYMLAKKYSSSSDVRLKEEIRPLSDSESKVDQLSGVSYQWKKDGSQDIGFIAQDVEKIFPELVGETPDGYKAVNYPNLVAVLLDAYQTRKERVDREIAERRQRIEILRRKIAELKQLTIRKETHL